MSIAVDMGRKRAMHDYFDERPLDEDAFNEFWYKLDHYPAQSGFQQMRISTRASALRATPASVFVDPRTQHLEALQVEDWNLHRRNDLSDFVGWPEALAEATLPKLASVAFRRGNIGAIDALSSLKSLKYLELDCTSELIGELRCSSLESLSLPALTEAALACIIQGNGLHCPRLTHLSIAADKRESHEAVISGEDLLAVFREDRLPKLRYLVVSNIRYCDGFFSKLAETPLLAHLEQLCLLGDFEEEATDDLVKVGFAPFAHLHAWELDREIDLDRFEPPNLRPVGGMKFFPIVGRVVKPDVLTDAKGRHDPVLEEQTNESKNDNFRRKLAPIAAKLEVEFGDLFLGYVRRVWRVLPDWFRTPDEWSDLREFCLNEFGSYDGHGGVIIGEGLGGDLRVARCNGDGVVSRIVEWIPHEDILGFEKHRKKRPAVPVGFQRGDRVVHQKLGAGTIAFTPKPGFSHVSWDDGSESIRLNRFLEHASANELDGE